MSTRMPKVRSRNASSWRPVPPESGSSRGVPIGEVGVDIVIAVENLLDVSYETIELFPEPGRSLLLRVEIRR